MVKVDKYIFLANFFVLDMEEDKDVPLIMGRPFLATKRTLIDVATGELIMKVNDEQMIFNIFKVMKYPKSIYGCFKSMSFKGLSKKFKKRVNHQTLWIDF